MVKDKLTFKTLMESNVLLSIAEGAASSREYGIKSWDPDGRLYRTYTS